MKLAKDCLDIGLLSGSPDLIDFFARGVGLGDPEILRVTKQVTQHRFDFEGSILKINLVPGFASSERSGYRSVALAREGIGDVTPLVGPDGIRVELVPPGDRGIHQLGIELRVPDLGAARRYFEDGLRWSTAANGVSGLQVTLGRSVVRVEEDADAPRRVQMPVQGWTYMTVQIHDCDAETAALVGRGIRVAAPAKTMGDVARFAMVADDWGNELEISERFSLVGRR